MRVLHLTILLVFLLTSCEDEKTETPAQVMAKKLQADIASSATPIEDILVLNALDSTSIFVGSSYVITSDGFIEITGNAGQSATFNLGELKSYLISSGSLTLYY